MPSGLRRMHPPVMLAITAHRPYSRAELLRDISDRRLRRLVREGSLRRLRRDCYASPLMPNELQRALSIGGSLCCVSALSALGAWRPPRVGLHIAVTRNAARLGLSRGPQGPVTVHWSMESVEAPVSTPVRAAARLITCLPRPTSIAVLDSALRAGLLDTIDIRDAMAGAPLTRRFPVSDLDAHAESGVESLVRVALRDVGMRVASQVTIPGVGRVDLLVEGVVIVEVDGREWHRGEQERDYRRDLEALRAGYRVVRVDYAHAVAHPELVIAAVERAASVRWGGGRRVQLLRSSR